MGNRIVRNLPDGKYKAAVGNVLADGENPFSTESEVKEEVTTTEVINGMIEDIVGSSNDAATQILGSAWRMPTQGEWMELTNTCTMTWTTVEGINGYLVSNNGNSIFLPASGYREETSTYSTGTEGHYWTGSRWSGGVTATFGAFDTTNPSNSGSWIRAYGRSIRPVSNTEGVDLGLSVKWASVNLGATNPQDYGDFFAWGEIETKTDFTYSNYICPSGSYGTENDPMTHVTRPATLTILHKDNHNSHVTVEQKEEWTSKQDQLSQAQIDATNSGITSGKVETYDGYAAGKQDALGFTPENSANKKTSLAENSDTYYPTQKAVKTAIDAKTLQGDEPQNITVDQNEKRIKLAQTLRNILNITGGVGEESALRLFCNSDILRNPEIFISKALIYLNALEVRLKTGNVDRLVLTSAQTALKSQSGASVLDATGNNIQIFDGGGNILVSRDNNGALDLLRRKENNITPTLSARENDFTLYNSNASHSPLLSSTDKIFTLHDHAGGQLFRVEQTENGTDFRIFRQGSTKPFAIFDSSTNTFRLFGNEAGGNATKLIEQQNDLATIYYGIGNTEIFRHERVGEAIGYSVSNAFGNGVLRSAIFKGTTAQWNALTPDVKSTYCTAILID